MSQHSSPYAGSTQMPADAGQRSEMPRRSSQMLPGGLFAPGTPVEVRTFTGHQETSWTGKLAEFGSVPAPHIVLTDTGYLDGRMVVFLGPGVIIRSAAPRHPALG